MNKRRYKSPKAKKLHKASAPVVTRKGSDSVSPPAAATTRPPERPDLEPTPPATTDATRDSLIADLESIAEVLSKPNKR